MDYLQAYRTLSKQMHGACPIEQGFYMRFADNECKLHGRLPGDRSPACGCFSEAAETCYSRSQEATVIRLPVRAKRRWAA